MLVMTSTIRVGQSKFATAPIDEDSSERILNCIQTLSELDVKPAVHGIFLSDTKAAYSKMVAAQEVCPCCGCITLVTYLFAQKKAAEKRELEAAKQDVVRVDDLLTFRQFTKKAADDVIDVRILRSEFRRCHFNLPELVV